MDIKEVEILKRCIAIIDRTIRSEEVFGCDEEDAWVTLKDFVREALERTRWIPVSERLPTEDDSDENGYVWVWNKNGRGTWNWRDVVFHNHIVKITHWMPFPEPPQEVE